MAKAKLKITHSLDKTHSLKIIQDKEKPIAADIMAQAIVDIAEAMQYLNRTRLNRRAVVTLIHEHSKIPRRDIEIVLNNLESLEETWLKR